MTKPKLDVAKTAAEKKLAIERLTPAQWEKFLEEIAEHTNIAEACRVSGVSSSSFYQRLNGRASLNLPADLEFGLRYEEARDAGWEKLEQIAKKRAFEGYQEPVFYQGAQVATVTRFSDTLTCFLLKGNRPKKFVDRSEATVNQGGPGGRFNGMTNEELDALIKRSEG